MTHHGERSQSGFIAGGEAGREAASEADSGSEVADQSAAMRVSHGAIARRYGVQMQVRAQPSERDRQLHLSRREVQRMAAPALSAEAAPDQAVQESAAAGVRGPASALPFIGNLQPLFGRHDLSSVRAHTDGPAADACASMGASAFATGNDVAFSAPPSLHTAAHEAAHVVQQRGGVQLEGGVGRAGDLFEQHADAVADRVVRGESAEGLFEPGGGTVAAAQPAVQRRGEAKVRKGSNGPTVKKLQQRLNAKGTEPPLKIDGDFGPITKAAVVAFQTGHVDGKGKPLEPDGIVGTLTWGAINDEHEAEEIENKDAALGKHIADDMNKNNQDPHTADQGVHYDFNYKADHPDRWQDDYSNGLADDQYFERTDWMDWRLKPKMSASAGIKAWLRGLTIAECNSAIVAIQTDAVRAAIGDAKFDDHFGSTDKVVPTDARMRIKTGTSGTVVDGMNKPTEGAEKADAGSFGKRPVQQGDWCYFYNHPQYLLKHPGGAFQGENSIYMGVNSAGKQLWSGMGVDNATEAQMLDAMMGAYNGDRDEWDQKRLVEITATNGGTLPAEYDLKSGVFPETLTDVSQILSAPEYTIGGEKRKGGFVSDNPSRLDTKKIEALAS